MLSACIEGMMAVLYVSERDISLHNLVAESAEVGTRLLYSATLDHGFCFDVSPESQSPGFKPFETYRYIPSLVWIIW